MGKEKDIPCSYIRPLPSVPRQARTSGEYSWICLDRLSPPPHIYRHPVGPTTVRSGFEARAPATAQSARSTAYRQTLLPEKFTVDGSNMKKESWSPRTVPLRRHEYDRIPSDGVMISRSQTSYDIKECTQEITQKPKPVIKAPKQASSRERRKRVTFKEHLEENPTKHISTILHHQRNTLAKVEESFISSQDADAYGNSNASVIRRRNVQRSCKSGITKQQRQVRKSSRTKPVKRKRHKRYHSANESVGTPKRANNKYTARHGAKTAPSSIKHRPTQIKQQSVCWLCFKFVLTLIKLSVLRVVRGFVTGYRFVKRKVKKAFERHYDIPKEWNGKSYSFQPWQTGFSEQFVLHNDSSRYTFTSC